MLLIITDLVRSNIAQELLLVAETESVHISALQSVLLNIRLCHLILCVVFLVAP